MNFNLVEMYNGLLRFNKHILNELAEGLKHLPNLDGVSKGDSLIINEQGNPAQGSTAFIPTFENAAYGIEWTKDDNDIIRIGNAKFHRELPIQNRLKGCVYNEKKISYFLNPTGWAKPLENGLIPSLDGSDGDVGVSVPEFYICVKDTGTKYQLQISDFNIDGTFTRIHPFIISHTKTMTRTREDGKEEVFSACIKHDDTRYLGGNNPIVQTYWTAEHNIGNGSTNGDFYTLGNYNADGSNFDTYPAVYRGILNFFGDIWTFIRDVVIVNRNANYNSVYLLKKGVNHADITIDNIQDKCYFIGDQANSNNFITEFDFRFGPYFIPNKVGTNKKADYNWIRDNNGQDTDKAVRVLLLGGGAHSGSGAGSGYFGSDLVRSDSSAVVGFFTTVKLD